MRANEGLAQVFDGNTDFISQSPTAAQTLHSGMMWLLFNSRHAFSPSSLEINACII